MVERPVEEWEPEAWVGQRVAVYLDAKESSETKAIGVLELLDDGGVVVEEDEGVIAFYPWRFILAVKVGEPEEPARRRSIRGSREPQLEGPEEVPRSGPRGPTGPSRRPEGPSGPSRRPEGPSGPSRRPQGPSGPKRRPQGPSGPGRR